MSQKTIILNLRMNFLRNGLHLFKKKVFKTAEADWREGSAYRATSKGLPVGEEAKQCCATQTWICQGSMFRQCSQHVPSRQGWGSGEGKKVFVIIFVCVKLWKWNKQIPVTACHTGWSWAAYPPGIFSQIMLSGGSHPTTECQGHSVSLHWGTVGPAVQTKDASLSHWKKEFLRVWMTSPSASLKDRNEPAGGQAKRCVWFPAGASN